MTDRYTFPGANAAAQAGPRLLKQIAFGEGKYIELYETASGKWQVRFADEWVQPCMTLAYAEAEFGRLIGKHIKEIALHALGVADGPADG